MECKNYFNRRKEYQADHIGLVYNMVIDKHTKKVSRFGVPSILARFHNRVRENIIIGKIRKEYRLLGIDTDQINNSDFKKHIMSAGGRS